VFNDGGANYDFRIEGDTNANLFFVDASAEAVGIGVTGPRANLEISDGSTNTAGEAVNELYVVGATTTGSEGIVTIPIKRFACSR
jgi:hypothetical protein